MAKKKAAVAHQGDAREQSLWSQLLHLQAAVAEHRKILADVEVDVRNQAVEIEDLRRMVKEMELPGKEGGGK